MEIVEAIITRRERWASLTLVTITVYLKGLPVIVLNNKTTEINMRQTYWAFTANKALAVARTCGNTRAWTQHSPFKDEEILNISLVMYLTFPDTGCCIISLTQQKVTCENSRMDFSFRAQQHMLQKENNKLIALLANQPETQHRAGWSSVGFLRPCCDNRDTYLQSYWLGCWGPIGKVYPASNCLTKHSYLPAASL